MFDENGSQQSSVCKFHQRGYCKYGDHCQKYHNNNICKERVCRDRNCSERHPRSCKYFSLDGKCRFPRCVYAHIKYQAQNKIDILEKEVKDLKLKITDLNAMSEFMAKILTLEEMTPRIPIINKDPSTKVVIVAINHVPFSRTVVL